MRDLSPVMASHRHIFLDALRGFALLGVCMANYPEFSLYTFQQEEVAAAMPDAGTDLIVKFLLCLLVDGKFYTLFSLLFGIGFSIIISHASQRGADGFRIFYRRMTILAFIGLAHLMLVWSGDILLLYALLGMLLPMFRNMSDRKILTTAAVLLLMPMAVEIFRSVTGTTLAVYPYRQWWHYAGLYGITENNFGTWLRDADSYREISQFLIQGAWERLYEFVDGNRYFKVFGLFLIGFVAGRRKIYADLPAHKSFLTRVALWGMLAGFPLSIFYALSNIEGHPWGQPVHAFLYAVSVYPLGFSYAAILGLLCIRHSRMTIWRWFAAPGRMALTNYIFQSVAGAFIFYGIGLGLGAKFGLFRTEIVAVGVFVSEMVLSMVWLHSFQYGPLEWLWRMLTYGKRLDILKRRAD